MKLLKRVLWSTTTETGLTCLTQSGDDKMINKITFAKTLVAIGVIVLSAGTLQAHPVNKVTPTSKSLAYKSQSPHDILTLDRYVGSAGNIEICLQAKNGITWRKVMHIYAGPKRLIKTLKTQDNTTRDCTKIQTAEFAPKYARFTLVKAGFGGVNTETLHTGRFNVHKYDGMGFTINWIKD